MSVRVLCVAALTALTVAGCTSAERSNPQSTSSSGTAMSSSAVTTSAQTSSTTTAPASGPVADILHAQQVGAEDFHDMSFGGEKPEDMTSNGSMVAFITPSGNITCTWSPEDPTGELGVNCHAEERTSQAPARPANCDLNWATGYVQLSPAGVVEDGVCTGGVLTPSIANTLAYDSALVAGDFGCLSAVAGVTCAHIPSGRGFFLSREKLTTF